MDCSNWTEIRDQSFPSCYFDCEPKSNYRGNDWEQDFNFEETDLNEKACDQVRRILLGKENAEILKLEEDVSTLEKQLAWADVSWSEMNSVPLSEKVKSIDLSIRSFRITNLGDDRVFGETSLAYRKLVDRWLKILKLLPEKYFNQKAKQFAGHISESVSSDLRMVSDETGKDEKVSKGTKSDQTEKKKTDTQGTRIPGGSCSDIQMNESDSLLEFINQKREQLANRNPKDRKKKGKSVDLLLKSQKPKAKVEYDLYEPQNQSVQLKRKSQNLPGTENEKKLKGPNHYLTFTLPTNSTQSSNMENLDNLNFSIANAKMEETPKVLPSSKVPSATPGRMDLSVLKVIDLKDMAKCMNLKGYSKLTKSELIEELNSKIANRGKCT